MLFLASEVRLPFGLPLYVQALGFWIMEAEHGRIRSITALLSRAMIAHLAEKKAGTCESMDPSGGGSLILARFSPLLSPLVHCQVSCKRIFPFGIASGTEQQISVINSPLSFTW